MTILGMHCLQDITMTVDFTEAAGAGSMAGWKTAAYAPIFHLEPSDCIGFRASHMSTKLKQFPSQSLQVRLAFDQWLPRPVASLLERAGGPRTIGLHAWYRHSNEDAWSSFKARSRNDTTAYYC